MRKEPLTARDAERRPSRRASHSPKTRNLTPTEARFRKLFALIVVIVFSVLFLRVIAPFIEAVLLAAVLSGLLYPFYRWLVRSVNRFVAAGATVLLVLIAIVLPLVALVGVLTNEALSLTERVAPWVEQQADSAELAFEVPSWLPFAERLEPYRGQILSVLGDIASQGGTFLVDSVSALTQGTFSFLLNLFVMLYAMFFFLLAGPRLLDIFEHTPLAPTDRQIIAEKGVSITRATLKGAVVIGAVQGALAGLAFALTGIPAPVLWGAVTALASLVPIVGTALVCVPAVLFLLLTEKIVAGLALAVWCAIAVGGIDNILRPRLVGSDTRMPDLLVLLATLGGIAMFGATGIVIGPVIAGFFITSWHIFAATFERELESSETSPALLDKEDEVPSG